MPYPPHTQKVICFVWIFQSNSGTAQYETLMYSDATTSCNCRGWCRKVLPDGSRSCRHTRLVDMGLAQTQALRFHDYTHFNGVPKPQPQNTKEQHGKNKDGIPTVGQLGRRKIL